jgi:hypothetical protein
MMAVEQPFGCHWLRQCFYKSYRIVSGRSAADIRLLSPRALAYFMRALNCKALK